MTVVHQRLNLMVVVACLTIYGCVRKAPADHFFCPECAALDAIVEDRDSVKAICEFCDDTIRYPENVVKLVYNDSGKLYMITVGWRHVGDGHTMCRDCFNTYVKEWSLQPLFSTEKRYRAFLKAERRRRYGKSPKPACK